MCGTINPTKPTLPAVVTATAVSGLVTMLWLLRRGIDGYVQNATASLFTLIYVPFLGSFVALLLAEGGLYRALHDTQFRE